MNQGDARWMRWCKVIAALSDECDWKLSAEDIERYVLALDVLLPDTCTEKDIRRVCGYYHADHRTVEVLQNSHLSGHDECWTVWVRYVAEILRKAGLYWSSDNAVDGDDLAQVAQMALMVSLANFAYRSSLATWAHTVVVQSVRRHIRDSRAKKRAQRPDSLDALPDLDVVAREDDEPEQRALHTMLIGQIQVVLVQRGDDRLAFIFYLWASEGRPAEEIGTLVHLHPSRVRALLVHARTILQQHPTIQTWVV